MNPAATTLEIITAGGATAPGVNLTALTGLAGLWAVGYLTACAVWPFTACRRCHGTATLRSPTGRAWRPCPRCHGTGRRTRTGRRAWDTLHHPHHDNDD